MRASTQRISSMFLALLFIVGAVMTYSLLIKPTYALISEKRAELASKEQLRTAQESYTAEIRELLNKTQESSELQRTLSLALPLDPNVPRGVHHLFGLAAMNQLAGPSLSSRVVPTRASPSATLRGIGVLQYSLDLYGSYEGLKGFLQGVESNVRVMHVKSLKMTRVDPTNPLQNNFKYSMIIDAYYQAE